MANNKLKKFCSLAKYLQQIDKDLFGVFEDLCQTHLLRPARGSDGVTMLYPKEKAYRNKIINAAYSSTPEVAVNMLRSLILQGYHDSSASFGKNVVNALNQKLNVKEASDKVAKLDSGLEITLDKSFVPMNRDNMSVFILSGKGEIPLNGSVVSVEKKAPKTGGFAASSRDALHKYIEDVYANEIGTDDNIYVKKVYLQLKYLSEKGANVDGALSDYLGNDEFSDSYLLDMYCLRKHSGCFSALLECLKTSDINILNKITRDCYASIKETCIKPDELVVHSGTRMSNISSPMDIRQRVFELYNNDKDRIGRDLFIVFCNVCRDLWNTDSDKVGSFRNFAYLASKVYTTCIDILNQEFDIARDLTLYGNLLKSDVFMFHPQARYDSTNVKLPVPKSLPSPLDMNLYSLSGFINSSKKSVGGGKSSYLLEGL
jgi:hypothetical protein